MTQLEFLGATAAAGNEWLLKRKREKQRGITIVLGGKEKLGGGGFL